MMMKRKIGCISALLWIIISVLTVPNSAFAKEKQEATVIDWLVEEKILNQDFDITEIKKSPNTMITRQEFISLLVNALQVEVEDYADLTLDFADYNLIPAKLRSYIKVAKGIDILKPVTKKNRQYIKPDKLLTRQMAAYYLGKAIGVELDLPLEEYTDGNKVADDVLTYVTGLVRADILLGKTETKYKPTAKVSWEEAAQIILRASQKGYFTKNTLRAVSKKDEFSKPTGLAVDQSKGILYIADTNKNQIKQYEEGKIELTAGRLTAKDFYGEYLGGYIDGAAAEAVFDKPSCLYVTKNGILVADSNNNCIRFINKETNKVMLLIEDLKHPQGITATPEGIIYISDTGNDCIKMIDLEGKVSVYAGISGKAGYQDGKADKAMFYAPMGLCYADNTLYVADSGNQRIRAIKAGEVTTLAGASTEYKEDSLEFIGGYRDGDREIALFDMPTALAVSKDGSIYVADTVNARIRVIKDDKVSTLIGNLPKAGSKEEFTLVAPRGLAIHEKGLYITDAFLDRLFYYELSE